VQHYDTVPEDWLGATVVLIGGGPSLTPAQVEACRNRTDENGCRVRVVAINNAYALAPFADVLYFCDDKWWQWHHKKLGEWRGEIWRLQGGLHDFGDARIKVLRNLDQHGGLSARRDGLHTGQNSGYQAIGYAVHRGAKRILLLGYDMKSDLVGGRPKTHWFGDHPGGTSPDIYRTFLPHFDTLVKPLAALGVEVLNCTPGSALKTFPHKSLAEALPAMVRAQAA
jgi:hypothetical protein